MALVRTVGPDKSFIDYYQAVCATRKGLQNCFGMRIANGHCCAVVKIGNVQSFPYGPRYPLPVKIYDLPNPLHNTVENHLLNFPASDLLEVLQGRKSFQEAVNAPPEIEPANDSNGKRTGLGESSET
jgi:hypothetical protein